MELIISFSELNDFIFCPLSLYFHALYKDRAQLTYQCNDQVAGTLAHQTIDDMRYRSEEASLKALSVFSEKYSLLGKIDLYFSQAKCLRERKKTIKAIYPGYKFQLYAQYFAMCEMGYEVKSLELYSMSDHKTYPIALPEDDPDCFAAFEQTIQNIKTFNQYTFIQENIEKCKHCIYHAACPQEVIC